MALWTACSRVIPITQYYRAWQSLTKPSYDGPILIQKAKSRCSSASSLAISLLVPVLESQWLDFLEYDTSAVNRHCASGFMYCHSPLFIPLLSLYIFLMYLLYLHAIHAPHESGWVARRLCLRLRKSARRRSAKRKAQGTGLRHKAHASCAHNRNDSILVSLADQLDSHFPFSCFCCRAGGGNGLYIRCCFSFRLNTMHVL